MSARFKAPKYEAKAKRQVEIPFHGTVVAGAHTALTIKVVEIVGVPS